MEYKILEADIISSERIVRIDEDGSEWFIPQDEANSDYQQYLIDTDGGLPLPKETK